MVATSWPDGISWTSRSNRAHVRPDREAARLQQKHKIKNQRDRKHRKNSDHWYVTIEIVTTSTALTFFFFFLFFSFNSIKFLFGWKLFCYATRSLYALHSMLLSFSVEVFRLIFMKWMCGKNIHFYRLCVHAVVNWTNLKFLHNFISFFCFFLFFLNFSIHMSLETNTRKKNEILCERENR